jgi:ABC-type dipeptide/oligopeptide/nickel transport system permease component
LRRGYDKIIPYIIRRGIAAIPTLLGVVTLVFLIIRLVPGDPALVLLDQFATEENVRALHEKYGLDEPILTQYAKYLAGLLEGDFGWSFATGNPAMQEILRLLPYTLRLVAGSMLVSVGMGMPIGILSAAHRNSIGDRSGMVLALTFLSVPGFCLGLLLLLLFSVKLDWFPATGAGDPGDVLSTLTHLVLPAFTLGASEAAFIARMTRSALLEVMAEDFIRTARAKGLGNRRVLYRHALRNSLLPVVTVVGINLGRLLAGSVVVETVFSRPGIGKLLMDSITARDYMQIQATVIFIGLCYVLTNLVVDLSYAFLDPRIRY